MIDAFRRGLRFECTRCGECCTRLPGNLPLAIRDVPRMARHLGMSIRAFVETYGVHVIDRVRYEGRILEVPSIELGVPPSGRCVFLDDERRCTIHEAKPSVCSRTPFVTYVAEGGPGPWAEAVAYCPGIGVGERYTAARIRHLLREEAANDDAEIDVILRHGGDLGKLFGTDLPDPEIREATLEGEGIHGNSGSASPHHAPHPDQTLARSAPRRRRNARSAPRDRAQAPRQPGAAKRRPSRTVIASR